MIEEVLDLVDLVLIMSVNPGFGGQKLIESSLLKIERLAQARGNRSFLIEVDGGVTAKNIRRLRQAGVDVFVAGSAIFAAKDRRHAIAELRSALKGE
jgi:ribulose-phosphate 3-epimerase